VGNECEVSRGRAKGTGDVRDDSEAWKEKQDALQHGN
jgi:hypothetical protein